MASNFILFFAASLVACSGGAAAELLDGHPGMLRIVTYNVRRFEGQRGENTVAAIGDALAELSPDVVALNEVDLGLRPEALSLLAERLGGFSVAFFGHTKGRYGNALLSRHPIVAKRETHLRGGTELSIPAGTRKFNGEIAREGERYRIARGLLECDIEIPELEGDASKRVTVAVTHLDHMSEEQRTSQVQHVMETMKAGSLPMLLVGDLNALTRSDYTQQEWSALEQRAAQNRWSAPEAARCLDTLSDAGFSDVFRTSFGEGPLNELPRNGENTIFTGHVGDPMYRIDYCFVADAAGLEVTRARVLSNVSLSDHFPVAFDLVARSAVDL